MYNKIVILLIFSFVSLCNAYAQFPAGEAPNLASTSSSWQRQDPPKEPQIEALSRFVEDNGAVAMKNILEAEQVFCYEVFPQDSSYTGYTIDGYPIRGFCGILDKNARDAINRGFFASDDAVNFNSSEDCLVQPKMILRFVRGIDYTDVLLSSPCYAVALFYGGKVVAYNFHPSAQMIDTVITRMSALHQEFISPALLNQLLPIGVIQNEEQRKMINKSREPIRKWEDSAKQKIQQQEEEAKRQNSGWNKLKTRL